MVATGGIGGPEKTYKFPQALPQEPHHLCLFEHVEGCRVCSELYGHYLLPSGRLAHFYIGDTVRKGHCIGLVHPPEVPFSTEVCVRCSRKASLHQLRYIPVSGTLRMP